MHSSADDLKRLTEFFNDWQQATVRLQIAQQTMTGAQADAIAKEARFKGAVEFVGGPKATFNFSPEAGVTVNMPTDEPSTSAPLVVEANGSAPSAE